MFRAFFRTKGLCLTFLLLSGCHRQEDGGSQNIEEGTGGGGSRVELRPGPRPVESAPPPHKQEKTTEQIKPAAHFVLSGPALLERIARSGKKATIVNAWASWCGPCRREFPMLVALKDSLSAQNVEILFISVDEEQARGAAIDFAGQHGVSPPLLFAQRPLAAFKEAMHPSWPGMLPATFLFDENGVVRYFWGGPVYEKELLPIVEDFLQGKEIDGIARVGLRKGKELR